MLNEEAIKAEKKILRGKQYESNEERLEALIAFFKKSLEKRESVKKDGSGKRERTTTERAKESKEQDQTMSPKKKKANPKEKKKQMDLDSENGSKQSTEGKKKTSGEIKTKLPVHLTPKAKDKMEKKAESNVELLAAKNILTSSLSDQFGQNVTSESSTCIPVPEDTPLTSTWALCNQQLDVPEFRPNETLSPPSLPGNLFMSLMNLIFSISVRLLLTFMQLEFTPM